jgi:hypothetical protein
MIQPIIGIQAKRAKISQSNNQTTIPTNMPAITSEALANYYQVPYFLVFNFNIKFLLPDYYIRHVHAFSPSNCYCRYGDGYWEYCRGLSSELFAIY